MNSANWRLNTQAANVHGAGIVDFHNVDGTEDLLYAATSESTVGMELGQSMEAVKFQFNHLLSKVKFSFTNGFTNNNAYIDVKNVTMKVPSGTKELIMVGNANCQVTGATLIKRSTHVHRYQINEGTREIIITHPKQDFKFLNEVIFK
jgi:hypothetical protein